MSYKLLTIFNTAGVNRQGELANLDAKFEWYSHCINSLLSQTFKDHRIVISSCCNTDVLRKKLLERFGNAISYSFIDEVHPVNLTFNLSVCRAVKKFGEAEGYLFVDSGINFNDPEAIDKAYSLFKSGPYAMVSILASDDNVSAWGNRAFAQHMETAIAGGASFDIPVGCALNCHSQIFSNDIYREYGERLDPDIFASYCTESVFSFICAAIKKKWGVLGGVILEHRKGLDGASSGFMGEGFHPWDHTYYSPRSMREIITDPEAISCGLGYEMVNHVMDCDYSCYDENGYCKNDRLKEFIRKNLYIQREYLDYDSINGIFIR